MINRLINVNRRNEEMPYYKCLRSTLIPNGQAKDEIKTRLMAARNALFQLMKFLRKRREIIMKTRPYNCSSFDLAMAA